MKFQVNSGWSIGQFLIPPSTIIDIGDKAEHELSEWERLAKGRVPPIDSCALDFDAALSMHRNYAEFRYRLHRSLSVHDEAVFQRVIGGEISEEALQRYWPTGRG